MGDSTYSYTADYRPSSRSIPMDWRVMEVQGAHILSPSPDVIRVVAYDADRLAAASAMLRLAGCRKASDRVLYQDEVQIEWREEPPPPS